MSRWPYWISGFFLLDAMGCLGFIDELVYGEPWAGKPGDKITGSLALLTLLSALTLFAWRYRLGRGVSIGGTLAIALIGFLFLSSFWSVDPGSSTKESIVYSYILLGGIGVAGALDGDEYMEVMSRIVFLAAIFSIALLIFSPGHAKDDGGEVRGICAQKNAFGQLMAIGVLCTLHCLRASRRLEILKLLMLPVFIGLAVVSSSATSCVIIFIFCSMHVLMGMYRKPGLMRQLSVMLAIVLIPTIILVSVFPDVILGLLGKDPTLTGRTDIWAFVISDIMMKPLVGWGYYAFWTLDNPAALEISEAVKWIVPHSHNGLLEMLLSVGFFGTALFFLLLIRNTVLAVRCLGTSADALAISTIMSTVGLVVLAVSEPVLLNPTQPSTLVFFLTGIFCEQALSAARGRRDRVVLTRYPAGMPTAGFRR